MPRLLIIADCVMVLIGIWKYRFLPDEIPLLYSRTWGDSQIVEYWYILLLPILLHILYGFNVYICNKWYMHDKVLKQLVKIVNNVLVISTTVIFIKILFLVT